VRQMGKEVRHRMLEVDRGLQKVRQMVQEVRQMGKEVRHRMLEVDRGLQKVRHWMLEETMGCRR
jgi:hypothetical protein